MDNLNFDKPVNRLGTGCEKWDLMPREFGLAVDQGLPMWVADMDFRAPEPVQEAVRRLLVHGVYGYHGDETEYHDAIICWMQSQHEWTITVEEIFSVHGLVNGFGLCVDAFTAPGDAVILFTPVYHAFERVLKASDRAITACPLKIVGGIYQMDFEDAQARLTGKEKMIALCSPHNPGGRVWSKVELESLGQFAKANNLLILSDEIHHDVVFPGQTHTPMALIEGVQDRLIMMTAASKTFNIAGAHNGNVIIPDAQLRLIFSKRLTALGISADGFGIEMSKAAYSLASRDWLEELVKYLNENSRLFDTGINAIPGLTSMPLQSTFLAWVDFSATGLPQEEIERRILREAQIAASPGRKFSLGGEYFMRFNLGTHRSLIEEAVNRLSKAFGQGT